MEKELNILYTCDNKFLNMTSVSIASVISNNAKSKINFFIASESNKDDYYYKLVDYYKENSNIKFIYLDCKKFDSILEKRRLDKWGSNSYYVYWKLFAYTNINVDNIWYLDSDVICLKEITNPILPKNKSLGMALDTSHALYNKIAGIPEDYYFYNSGSMYIDVKKWKNNKCEEKIIEYIEGYKHKPLMCDQDIIAIALQNDIELISPKYNYLSCFDYYGIKNCFSIYSLNKKKFYNQHIISSASKDTIFYHCLGGVYGRPWEENNFHPLRDTYQKYTMVSAFNDFSVPRKKGVLIALQKASRIFPSFIYNKLHNLAQITRLIVLKKRNM